MLVCTAFSAVSQILLKQSANQEHESALKEYLNWRVITAYLIFRAVGQYLCLYAGGDEVWTGA